MQLTQLFPSLIRHTIYPTQLKTSSTLYYDVVHQCWYEIDKSDISSRDDLFLTQFLQRADHDNPWYLLLTQGIIPQNHADSSIRILQYTTKRDSSQLRYAVELYFIHDALVIEATSQTFWIILLKDYSIEELEGFLGILENDFYLYGQLFIGQQHKISSTIHTIFSVEQLLFKRIQQYHLAAIYTFTDSVIFLLPTFLHQPIQQYLSEELIEIIIVLFRHHGNISSSAKALHIHRNTLLYRIQRFYDETTLDLKASEHLLIAYLAAQLLKLTELS